MMSAVKMDPVSVSKPVVGMLHRMDEPFDPVKERRAMLRWTAIILFLLCGSVGMWIYAAIIAVSDPTMAVVPDYHEKALRWDEHLASQKESDALGWTVHVVPGISKTSDGLRELTLFVRDPDAKPVQGAQASLRLYHLARGGQAMTVVMKEVDPGSYVAFVPMARNGNWHFDLEMKLDQQNFQWSASQDLQLP